MTGNAQEMCWNLYDYNGYDEYTEGGSDPTGASSGTTRVARGGSYESINISVTSRTGLSGGYSSEPNSRGRQDDVGFRVVRSAVVE